MDIVVLHNEEDNQPNIAFLESTLAATFHILSPASYLKTQPIRLPEAVIYFHSQPKQDLLHLKTIRKLIPSPIISVITKNEALLEEAYHHGSDDVIYSPFSIKEFILRLLSLLKRCGRQEKPHVNQPFTIQDLHVDPARFEVKRGKQIIPITRLEFTILHTLASYPDKVFLKKELYQLIWQDHYYDNGNVRNVHIRRLRKKIELDPNNPKIIMTKWGIGYKINLN